MTTGHFASTTIGNAPEVLFCNSKVGISAEPQNQQINLALLDVSKYFVLGMANTHE